MRLCKRRSRTTTLMSRMVKGCDKKKFIGLTESSDLSLILQARDFPHPCFRAAERIFKLVVCNRQRASWFSIGVLEEATDETYASGSIG